MSRKKKRSNNRRKTQQKLSRFQHRIAIKRESYQWQTAKKIVLKSDAIAIEDLQISNLIKRCKPKYDEKTSDPAPSHGARERAPREEKTLRSFEQT